MVRTAIIALLLFVMSAFAVGHLWNLLGFAEPIDELASSFWSIFIAITVAVFAVIALGSLALFTYITLCSVQGAFFFRPKALSLGNGRGKYSRQRVTVENQRAIVHTVELKAAAVTFELTQATEYAGELKCKATTTQDAFTENPADLIINASFFYPFKDVHLFDYEPHQGDALTVVGETISPLLSGLSSGSHTLNPIYGLRKKRAAFIVYPDATMTITGDSTAAAAAHSSGEKPINSMASGRALLIDKGKILDVATDDPYPRVTMGLSKDQKTVWLFVVDGKQPGYSEGLPLKAITQYMHEQGVHTALEMDGGGSATLARKHPKTGKFQLLNRPCHTKIPYRQRPIANHWLIRWRSPY